MKLTFEPAPHYRSPQSTGGIMKELTLCLCAVTLFAVIYYTMAFGASYGLRVVIMMALAVLAGCATEAVYYKATKQDVVKGICSSYPWVTAMILTLISSIDNSYYAIIVSVVIAIIFGKLVFGGFGQNIFNPAAFGEAILMNSFAAAKSADFATGATPTQAMNAYGWMLSAENFGTMVNRYGGLGKMLLGQYPSTIGSTCAILILICGAVMIYRKDIDWQAPVFYIGTIFVVSLLIGLMHGAGVWYAVFQVLAGGVVFGGVFMMTDPVTSPVTIPGRVIFAVGAACFTLIFRLRSNMADGVLYSILLMNMLTPAIDKLMDGNQIKNAAKNVRTVLIACAVMLVITLGVGFIAEGKLPAGAAVEKTSETVTAETAAVPEVLYADTASGN